MMVYDNFMSVQKKALTSVLWVSEIFVGKYGSFFFFSWLSHEDRWVRDPSAASFGCLPGKGGFDKANKFSDNDARMLQGTQCRQEIVDEGTRREVG